MIYPRVLPLFFLFIGLLSCQQTQETEESARLTVIFSDDKPSDIKIGTIHPFDFSDSLLAEAKLDTLDTDTIELVINLPKTTLAYLEIDENRNQLYLTPGDDLTISIKTEGEPPTVAYSGTGSAVNNYLAQINQIREDFVQTDRRYIWQLGEEEFMSQLDSLRGAYQAFHQAFTDTVTLSKHLDTLLSDRNRLMLISQKENYDLVHYSDRADGEINPNEITREESKYSYYEVPFDTAYLTSSLLAYEYAMALSMYLDLHIVWPISNRTLDIEKNPDAIDSLPLVTNQMIRGNSYPDRIREFLLARNALDFLSYQGITPTVEAVLHDFKIDYPASAYQKSLEAWYNKWLTIAPG
ncbi:MAG: hypothetical protein AAF944_17785, partial [Bacteroidota bacterium]